MLEAAKRLELERFDLSNKPSGTPASAWTMVRNRKISHAQHRNSLKSYFGAKNVRGAVCRSRLRGCPLGVRGKGKGPAGPFPSLHSPGGRSNQLHPPRPGKPSPKGCREARRLPDSFRSGGVYAARSDFSIAKSHLAAEKSFPLSLDLCPSGRGSKG